MSKGGIREFDYIPNIHGNEFANMYKALANHYLRKLCKQFGYEYSSVEWVRDEPGGTARLGDIFITFDDIRYVVDNSIPKEKFLEWDALDYELRSLEVGIRLTEKFTTIKKVSLRAFCEGAENPYSKAEMARFRRLAKRREEKIYGKNQD